MTAPSLLDIDGFLLDLDGTLYLGNRTFPWTGRFLETLRSKGKRLLFLTNNSSKSTADYLSSLNERGIPASRDEILTSGQSAIRYLRRETAINSIYLMATPSLEQEFREADFDLDADKPEAVVLGFDKTVTYEKIVRVSNLLLAGLPYFVTHADLVCPTETEPIPDTGSMMAMFETATGRVPTVLGKPYKPMVDAALDRLGTSRERAAMVGDRLYTDMRMASENGLCAILVLSGETTRDDLKDSGQHVDFVFEDVGKITDMLLAGGLAGGFSGGLSGGFSGGRISR